MGWFSSNKSWTNQAKNMGNPGSPGTGMFGSRSRRKRCPPVDDCAVKKTLMASAAEQRLWGVKTKKEVRQAKAAAAKIAARQRAGKPTGSWPYKGSYNPTKGRGKGHG